MRQKQNRKRIFTSLREISGASSHRWRGFLNILAVFMIWMLLCFGIFMWQADLMREKAYSRCEDAHRILDTVVNMSREQTGDIYREKELLEDFWLFWNHDVESYMEQRIQNNHEQRAMKSFPEYMNVFITEHQNIYNKIYFVTKKGIYSLEANPEGGGGIYSYDAAQSQFEKDCRDGEGGYPISVNVQNIYHMKESVGEIIFLVNEEYLFGALKSSGDSYVLLEHGEIRKYWGDLSEKKQSSDIMAHWMIYECSTHGNRIEIGFQTLDVILENWPVFLLVTGIFFMVAGMMFFWTRRMTKENEEFLEEFIHVIQLAKKGEFQRIKVRKRKDSYAMLALEINDMLSKLDVHIKKEYILKGMQQDAEMKAMLYQINPHFLYNTLEIIKAQANIQGNVTVSDALFDLGSMYRMLVKLGDTITLRQEIELLSHYLNILELGNQENFYYEIDVDEEMMELATVKFWMQPLAENYFVHGYGKEREYNLFSVQGQKKEDGYQLLIMDNGSGMEAEEMEKLNLELSRQTGIPRNKIGIRNVCQRLRYFYRNRMTFQMAQNVPRGLRIEIFIEKDWDEG